MPELNEVTTTKAEGVVEVTTVDVEPITSPPPSVVKKAAVKPAIKKPVTKPPVKKVPVKEEKSEPVDVVVPEDANQSEINYLRPPMEQLVKDFEQHILTLKVNDQPLKKLGYKCGKLIFGLEIPDAKDFRVIAFKARKKTKSVAGKSRCVFYFGITKDHSHIVKQFPGITATEFGKCAVQCKKPIDLKLDKTTYTETFNKNIELVISTLKELAEITITHKNEQFINLKEKQESKTTKKSQPKPKKKIANVD